MFKYMLAPLEDYSGSALRTLCYRHGADLTFTEMARVEGLVRRNKPTLAKIELADATPAQIQLLAGREDQLEKFLSSFKPSEGFMGFNLNFSCPSTDVIRQGRGCAMVKRVSKAGRLAGLVRKYNYPVSIKLRLGTNEYEKHHKVYLNCINSVDADFFVVHAKTGSQNSDEEADYSIFQECIEAAKKRNIPLIANGGIDSKEKVALLKGMGAGGVMIGRPAIKNPAIFDYLKGNKTPEIPEIKKEYFELLERFNSPGKYKTNLINYWKKH